jgi:mono/diheme cytochrome c family protein
MGKRLALLAIAVVASIPVVASAQGRDDPQVEKGRLVVAQVCTTCHTTLGRMLQVHKQTPQQWKDLVYFMISRGAQVMPDEIDSVTAFLVATAGRERPAARSPAPDSKTR